MTVSNTYDKQIYVANGEATSFAWSSDYDDTFGDLVVTQVDENEQIIKTYVKGEDYFIQNKQIFFNQAPASGTRIQIDRHTYRGQEVTFIEGEDFPAKDYETSLDRLFMIEQEQDTALDKEREERIAADIVLQNNIDAEEAARIAADTVLQSNIDAEAAARANADNALNTAITNEVSRAKGVEGTLSNLTTTAKSNLVAAINEVNSTSVKPSGVGNGIITITQAGETKGTFTTNQSANTTINLDAAGGVIFIKNMQPESYAGTTGASIDVSDYVEDDKYYFPIVLVNAASGYEELARSGFLGCSYTVALKSVFLDFTDNTYQKTNGSTYQVILFPISDGNLPAAGATGICNGTASLQSSLNLVTAVSGSSTDAQYPSAKCVYDALQANLPQPVLLSNIAVTTGATASSTLSIDLTTTYSVPYSDTIAYVPILNYPVEICQIVEKIYTGKANQKDLLILKTASGYKFPASSYFTMQCTLIPVKASSTAGTYYYGASAGMTGRLVKTISVASTDSDIPTAACVYSIVGDIETLLQNV